MKTAGEGAISEEQESDKKNIKKRTGARAEKNPRKWVRIPRSK